MKGGNAQESENRVASTIEEDGGANATRYERICRLIRGRVVGNVLDLAAGPNREKPLAARVAAVGREAQQASDQGHAPHHPVARNTLNFGISTARAIRIGSDGDRRVPHKEPSLAALAAPGFAARQLAEDVKDTATA